jgi:hypothetical protein
MKLILIKVKLNKKNKIMKKLFFALLIAFSFTVVSCGSKRVETETEVDEVEFVIETDEDLVSDSDEVVDGEELLETPVVE